MGDKMGVMDHHTPLKNWSVIKSETLLFDTWVCQNVSLLIGTKFQAKILSHVGVVDNKREK